MEKQIKNLIFNLIFIIYVYASDNLKGVYFINSIKNNNKLFAGYSNAYFKSFDSSRGFNKYYFALIPTDSNLYSIESLSSNKILGLDKGNNFRLFEKKDTKNNNYIYWNFIKLNNSEYLIQNNKTGKFLELDYYSVYCIKNISDNIIKSNYKIIPNSFKFNLIKLYEEAEIKPEHMKYIDEEPVDVVIKYIDLSDITLNRTGIHQIFKDEDHEELRYSIRSVFENIPWFRKIFIVMPNEKVKYLKPIEKINDRIVYIKDKDIIGFDTASNLCFHLRLWNLTKFNVSDNIILMDDDCFIGKQIKKSDFFYYDEEQKKVLPNIVSDEFQELNKGYINEEYNKSFSNKDKINPHTSDGWKLHTYAGYKLLLDNYPGQLIDGGFTHNALSININYVKEIYDLIKNKYKYANELLYSKQRTIYDFQFQTLYNTYTLNIKKAKVHTIPRIFYDINQLKKDVDLDIELFVINTSGENNYTDIDFQNLKKALESKFGEAIPYEIVYDTILKNIIIKYLGILYFIFKILFKAIIIIWILKYINNNFCFKRQRHSLKSYKKRHIMYKSEENYYLNNN